MKFVMDKMALGQVFSEYFGFPYNSSSNSLYIISQTVAEVPSGFILTPTQEAERR
jgi:hypothetical protein